MDIIYMFTKNNDLKPYYLWQEKFNSGVDKYIYYIPTELKPKIIKKYFENEFEYSLHAVQKKVGIKRLLKLIQKYNYGKAF